jgi:hypothetical protein
MIAGTRKIGSRSNRIYARVSARSASIIAFPVFENHGDQILEWLSELGQPELRPQPRLAAKLVKSMRNSATELERVRHSMRHSNLATFVRHAISAVECSQWDGARYILMTAFAFMSTRSIDPNKRASESAVLQFPMRPDAVSVESAAGLAMGIVTG